MWRRLKDVAVGVDLDELAPGKKVAKRGKKGKKVPATKSGQTGTGLGREAWNFLVPQVAAWRAVEVASNSRRSRPRASKSLRRCSITARTMAGLSHRILTKNVRAYTF